MLSPQRSPWALASSQTAHLASHQMQKVNGFLGGRGVLELPLEASLYSDSRKDTFHLIPELEGTFRSHLLWHRPDQL